MTTRDSRSGAPLQPGAGREASREATLSIDLDPSADAEPSHPSLAIGSSDVVQDDHTKIASPGARSRPPQAKSTRPPPIPDTSSRLGSTLGAYRILELLGKGGMGYVFRAEHIKLGREVALKQLRGDYAKRRDAVLRFFQEAKTVNRVRHRNIVDVTDFIELEDGTTFIIMELLNGQSMTRWARTGVDLPRALSVLVQICDGLGAAHAVGVVHRDLKPDNVFIVPTADNAELVKLLDFGVAKLVNREDEDIGFQTAAGSVIGTPAYMSPEQAGGMPVDHRSDIYSLGAIMYELFCGQPMFKGRSFGEYVRKHLTEIPVSPRRTANGAQIDERLEALIMRCLAKDPNARFAHILELRDGLLLLLAEIETLPPSVLVSRAAIPSAPTAVPLAQQLPPHMLPSQSANGATLTPAPPAHASQISSDQAALQYSHVVPTTHVGAATPWWVWFVGGAVAVGLGIAGALWLASKPSEPLATPATPRPTSAPIEQTPKLVELRFDSQPSGGVFADGRSAELCRTPCNFNVDLGDGGPTDRRTFVVRADGFEDKRVEVDFGVSQRDFSVSLIRNAPIVPTVTKIVVTAADNESDEDVETIDFTDAPAKSRGKKSGTGTKSRSKKAADKKLEAKVETRQPEERIEAPRADTAVETKAEEKPVKKIDRSDTIDPFNKKK